MMRRFQSVLTFLFFQLLLSANCFSQTNETLDNFSAFESNGKVYLNWTVTSGSTCDGIEIYHSQDETNFTRIGDIPGICGSSSEPVSYSFVHATPLQNSVNKYRLLLGLLGYSNTLTLNIIDTKESGYSIFPNPLQENSVLYFKNPRKEIFTFKIFDQSGKMISKSSISGDQISLRNSDYRPGLHYFFIMDESKIQISGKFFVPGK